ncbi:hypothetical protein NXS19_001772 [Fusarium pseudograminearum]|nr:hypothetical protein NXS19_001772 [Fusarium pseudograminearum]
MDATRLAGWPNARTVKSNTALAPPNARGFLLSPLNANLNTANRIASRNPTACVCFCILPMACQDAFTRREPQRQQVLVIEDLLQIFDEGLRCRELASKELGKGVVLVRWKSHVGTDKPWWEFKKGARPSRIAILFVWEKILDLCLNFCSNLPVRVSLAFLGIAACAVLERQILRLRSGLGRNGSIEEIKQ